MDVVAYLLRLARIRCLGGGCGGRHLIAGPAVRDPVLEGGEGGDADTLVGDLLEAFCALFQV